MSSRPGGSGFEARTRDPERRDFFDLRRRLGVIESLLGLGNGSGPSGSVDEVFIGNDAPPLPESYELWYDPDATAGEVPWIAVTFQNGWVNFGGAYQTAQYRKVGDMVQLRGIVKSGTTNVAIFTLPVGYRPALQMQYATEAGANVKGYCQVFQNGAVTCPAPATPTALTLAFEFSVTA